MPPHRLSTLLTLGALACAAGPAVRPAAVATSPAAPSPVQNRASAFAAARLSLINALQRFYTGECNQFGHGAPFQTLDPLRDIVVRRSGFSFTEGGTTYRNESANGQRVSFTAQRQFSYDGAASAEVHQWGPCFYVALPGSPIPELKPNSHGNGIWFKTRDDANSFLFAVQQLQAITTPDPNEEVAFEARAAEWRAASPKPPLSESANRHRILAEAAVRDRDFDTAIQHFESALATDPTWSSGNYNLALLYGQTGEYDEAVRYMKRFLALEPDSREAPAARDKLIVWQDRASRAP